MAIATECQTPGCQFLTHVADTQITVIVELPKERKLELTRKEAELLEANLHNALELVLARYFPPVNG